MMGHFREHCYPEKQLVGEFPPFRACGAEASTSLCPPNLEGIIMRSTVFALAALAVCGMAAPATAQTYYAFTTVDGGEQVSVTFVNAAFFGGDLTYNVNGGLLRVQEPRTPLVVKVRFADGTGFTTTTTLSPGNAVRSSIDPGARYWCIFIGRQRFAVNVTPLCANYAEGDTSVSVTPN